MKSVYLHDIPLIQALERFNQQLEDAGIGGILRVEEILIDEQAVGRVLAEPAWARLSSPHYHASAMDGFALRTKDIAGAMPTSPVTLAIGEQAVYLDTGDPLPDWANSVVPVENVEAFDGNGQLATDPRHPVAIRVRAGQPPWSHVRPMGEDIVTTQLILPAGHVLRPVDLGALIAGGLTKVRVSARPRVAVIPTGTELVPPGQMVKRGDIIEYNSIVLAGQILTWGGEPVRSGIIPDDYELIRKSVQQAADSCDLVLLNAGSSAGSEDFSARVVEDLGKLLVHGVAVRPGHPVILGMLKRSSGAEQADRLIPVIGVPGYPVSAALTGEIFVEPLLARWLGRAPAQPVEIEATLTRKVNSPAGDDDYMRVVAGRVGNKMLAAPISRGAGVITSLVRADGIVILPIGVQGLEAGAKVKVRLYRKPYELEQTLFAIGSHDMTLDLLAQFLAEHNRRLISANVGSLGGLIALRRGEAHFAGSHLLDPDSGEYNVKYIHEYLPGIPVRLITWVHREQGLLVPRGNPKGITSLGDLAREDVTFVNRQRGAGTRVLLDFELKKISIQPDQVRGYDQEEYTHLAVAAAVASGRADCGLAVTASASALDLDFIPLFHERYDLVIPEEHLQNHLLDPLFALIEDPKFRAAVAALPGYSIHEMGKVVTE
jgi:putative molybdopterin biosynthesis protein